MEAEGESTPSKPSKITSSAQETPAALSYPDWAGSMQAYYSGGAPPPIFASPVPSSSPHPYMWAGQHPMNMMSPYGTPVPYPAIYPPGAAYAHPNMQTTKVALNKSELEVKSQDSKAPAKKTKGNSVGGSSKAEDNGRTASGSGNGGASQSAESGSDDSLDASDENNNLELASSSKKGSFNQMLAEGVTAQNNDVGASAQTSVLGKSVVSIAATNLNIGMGSWNGSAPENGVTTSVAQGHQWTQDERELKRLKRKQSNRESARRSRLRKQAECEELQRRVDSLSGENQSLTQELQRLAEECKKLTAENTSIKGELTQMYGPEIMVNLDGKNPMTSLSEGGSKGNNS